MSPSLAVQDHQRDKQFANVLHGKDSTTSQSFLTQLSSKDKKAHEAEANKYLSFFSKKASEQTAADEAARLSEYTALTNAYYNLATDLYEYGWGQSFHFARYYRGEAFYQAIARHEHFLAHKMSIQTNAQVLDVGCGVGGPAREISEFTGCNITGLNNNDYQIARANIYAARRNMSHKLSFVKGDFMQMPFEDNKFDAVYAIEATVHAPRLEGVYSEIFRVLKPGGTFGVYEWLMTDAYDDSNPKHREIKYGIEEGDGIPNMLKIDECLRALKAVGFEITYNEDLADHDDYVPWYYPIEGNLRNIQTFWDAFTVFRMTGAGRKVTEYGVKFLEAIGLAPKGTAGISRALEVAADNLVAGGSQKLFTPMYLAICKKPETTNGH